MCSVNYTDFYKNTVKEYQNSIKNYSVKVNTENPDIADVANLFIAYTGLDEFTKGRPENNLVNKATIDKIINKLLVLIKRDLNQNNTKVKGEAYCYLATICIYKKEFQKALECYNKASDLDKYFLAYRADFKNTCLNDRAGALADYNEALAATDDPEHIEYINFQIQGIDVLRNADKHLKEVKSTCLQVWLILIAGIIFIAFKIYVLFFH